MKISTLFLVGLASLLGGCTTSVVKSYSVSAASSATNEGRIYARYSLLRTVLTVDVDNANATTSSGGNSAGASPTAGSSSGSPTTVNLTVTLPASGPAPTTTTTATAKPAKTDATSSSSLASTCTDWRKTYDDDRQIFLPYSAARSELLEDLNDWISGAPPVDLPTFKTLLGNYLGDKAAVAKAYPTAALIINLRKYCPAQAKISVTTKEEPDLDPAKSFFAVVTRKNLYDDQFNIQTDGGGALVSVGYTSTDRSADVAVNLVKSIASIAVSGFGVPPGVVAPVAGAAPARCPLTLGAGGWPDTLTTAPTLAQFGQLKTCIQDDQREFPELANIEVDHYERTFLARGQRVEVLPVSAIPGGLRFELECSDAVAPSQHPDRPTGKDPMAGNGVYVSTAQPCLVIVSQTSQSPDNYSTDLGLPRDQQVLSRTVFTALDSDQPIQLPVERTSFVTRTATYTFANGRLTTAVYNRPSPAVQAALLPATILGAAVGAVTGQITSRTTNLTAKTNYQNAETDYANAQLKLRQAQAALANGSATSTGAAPVAGAAP